MKLVVMLPAHNEENTIGKVIESIPKNIDRINEVEILVLDDNSTDSTVKVAKNSGADVLFFSKTRLGLSQIFRRGLEIALDLDAEVIVNIDADDQYDATEIPKLIEPILNGYADIVLGSRYVERLEHMSLSKKIGNKIATITTNLLSGLKISDAQTGFRALTREVALKLNVLSKYTYTQEMIIQAANKQLRIVEVPIIFKRREHGKSRLISNIFSYAKNAGITILKTYLNYRPLRTFLFIGGLILIIGFVIGFRVLFHYLTTGFVSPYIPSAILTAILLIVGFQVVTVGLFAEMVKSNRELIEEILIRIKEKRDRE